MDAPLLPLDHAWFTHRRHRILHGPGEAGHRCQHLPGDWASPLTVALGRLRGETLPRKAGLQDAQHPHGTQALALPPEPSVPTATKELAGDSQASERWRPAWAWASASAAARRARRASPTRSPWKWPPASAARRQTGGWSCAPGHAACAPAAAGPPAASCRCWPWPRTAHPASPPRQSSSETDHGVRGVRGVQGPQLSKAHTHRERGAGLPGSPGTSPLGTPRSPRRPPAGCRGRTRTVLCSQPAEHKDRGPRGRRSVAGAQGTIRVVGGPRLPARDPPR